MGYKEANWHRVTPGNVSGRRLYGKFRGRVTKVRLGPLPQPETEGNGDQMPFVKAIIPQLGGDQWETPWALPCLPFAGARHVMRDSETGEWQEADDKGKYGVWFSPPSPGDGVWIEFEQGDPRFPIWTGYWYFEGSMPSEFTEFEYLKNLPEGGAGKNTTYQQASFPKESNIQNSQHTENQTNSIPEGDDTVDRLPVTTGCKTPAGFFWLISDDQGHIRLHSPKRSYLLIDDKRGLSEEEKKEDVHDKKGKAYSVLHAQDKIEIVENASHNVAKGDNILRKYNNHIHPGPLEDTPPVPQWDFNSDLSQTAFVATSKKQLVSLDNIGNILKNDPTGILDSVNPMDDIGNMLSDLGIDDEIIDEVLDFGKDILGDLAGKTLDVAMAEGFKAVNSVIPVKTTLDVAGIINNFAKGDTSKGLKGVFEMVSDQIPGADALKTVVGFSASFIGGE